ncbi:unnamed protein product [Closterium sp. NIES-53]
MVRSERGERRWWAVAEAAGSRATGATGSLATGAAGSNPPNPPPPPNPPTTAAVAARRAGRASQRAVTSGEFALFSACLPPFPSPLLLSPTCSAHRLICTKVPPMDVARNAVEDAQPHPLPPLPCRFHSSSPFLSSPLPPTVTRLICTKVSPVDVARNAVEDARSACMRTYGSAPEVEIYGDPDFTFAYVPTHLHQMVFELCKNSLRAVQERFADADTDPPPIRVVVADGIEDVTIKISDEGGGIPRSGLPRIWTYLYSTARSPAAGGALQDTPSIMAGYGYGLPISRLYARYFGGDLQVVSMEGYGTDVYLHLNRLANVQEPLP